MRVEEKKNLCSLCDCDGKVRDCQDIFKSERKELQTCGFSMCYDWEDEVKKSFPFGVICYKWGIKKKVIKYAKDHLWYGLDGRVA